MGTSVGTDSEVAGVPEELAAMRRRLSQLTDLEGLGQAERLDVVTAAEEIKAAVAAVQGQAAAGFVDERDADAREARIRGDITKGEERRWRSSARSEVALAWRSSPGQGDRRVSIARAWCTVLPQTMASLAQGRISEYRASIVAKETSCLSPADRLEADRRLAGDLTRLGDRALTAAAQRVCVDLDQDSVVRRREKAAASRHVSTRPAPDGMAWLSILGPLTDVVGARASLQAAEQARWIATGDPDVDAKRAADERGRGAWMADTALARLSGRAEDEAQPVEVGLVMSDSTLLPDDDDTGGSAAPEGAAEAAEVPGWGAIPPHTAREHLLRLIDQLEASADGHEGQAGVWLRRLFTSPDGRDLVAMDSRQRFFTGALRKLIELRDPTCRVPWCDAPTRQVDHARRAADGGATSAVNGWGICQRHNLDKDTPGWVATVTNTGLDPGGRPHETRLTAPTGNEFPCPAPPLLGSGRDPASRPQRHGISHLETRFEIIYERVA